MNSATTTRTIAVLTPVAAALWALGIGLLVAGTVVGHDHRELLAWGLLSTTTGTGLGCLVAVHALLCRAVDSCAIITTASVKGNLDGAVDRTAVKVGGAIAEALLQADADTVPRDDGSSVRLYS